MNERIRLLAEQAGWMMGDEVEGFNTRLEKFAELIVRECISEILKWKAEPFPFDEDLAVSIIREHFNIK